MAQCERTSSDKDKVGLTLMLAALRQKLGHQICAGAAVLRDIASTPQFGRAN